MLRVGISDGVLMLGFDGRNGRSWQRLSFRVICTDCQFQPRQCCCCRKTKCWKSMLKANSQSAHDGENGDL